MKKLIILSTIAVGLTAFFPVLAATPTITATKLSCSNGYGTYKIHVVSTDYNFNIRINGSANMQENQSVTTSAGRDYNTNNWVTNNMLFELVKTSDNSVMKSVNVGTTGCSNVAAAATITAATISCVAAAVNTRESALGTAIGAYTQAVTSAYSIRSAALRQAYVNNSTASTIKAAVKAVWSAFSSSVKNAAKTWKTARNSAWSQFKNAVKVCNAPSSIGDGGNSGSEINGQ